MLDRNFIISLVLAFALIFGYNAYYQMRFGPYLDKAGKERVEAKKKADKAKAAAKADGQAPAAPEKGAEPAATPATQEAAPVPSPSPAPQTAAVPATQELQAASGAGHVEINTGVAIAVISAKGAALARYSLRSYHDEKGNPVELVTDTSAFEETQKKAFEKAKQDGKQAEFQHVDVYPTLGLKFPRRDFSSIVNSATFSHDAVEPKIDISAASAPKTVTFEYTDPAGVSIRKKYTFHPNEYFFDFSVEVVSTPQWGAFDYSLVWFGVRDDEPENMKYLSYHRPVLKIGGIYAMEGPDEKKRAKEYKGDIAWAALTHKYFAMISSPAGARESVVRANYIDGYNTTLEWERRSGAAEGFRFYLGPKRHDILDKYQDGRDAIIDYGWFNVVAQPLFWMMDKLHRLTGNWGWAIVLLTVGVKGALFPLSQKSFKSMKRLQKLQPQMQKIQEIYKNDKERMNQELMAFYRDNKVNPMGGCLPMFLQIPVFFALYKVLYESIELKGVPWILWITDLTQKDPYYITPVIMGVTMFLQQWMTPSAGDPTQRQIMLIMPVVFTFMFLSFPSGLILYWMVNNVLSIVQQWIINREPFEDESPKTQTT